MHLCSGTQTGEVTAVQNSAQAHVKGKEFLEAPLPLNMTYVTSAHNS